MSRIPKRIKLIYGWDGKVNQSIGQHTHGLFSTGKATRSDKEKISSIWTLRMSHTDTNTPASVCGDWKVLEKRVKLPAERKASKVPKMWKRKTFFLRFIIRKRKLENEQFFSLSADFLSEKELSFSIMCVFGLKVESFFAKYIASWTREKVCKVAKVADKKNKNFSF